MALRKTEAGNGWIWVKGEGHATVERGNRSCQASKEWTCSVVEGLAYWKAMAIHVQGHLKALGRKVAVDLQGGDG